MGYFIAYYRELKTCQRARLDCKVLSDLGTFFSLLELVGPNNFCNTSTKSAVIEVWRENHMLQRLWSEDICYKDFFQSARRIVHWNNPLNGFLLSLNRWQETYNGGQI